MIETAGALFKLPDSRLVLQRRDGHGKSPHKLGVFGGRLEGGEGPLNGVMREISEETNLDVSRLHFKPLTIIETSNQGLSDEEVRVHIYEVDLTDADFEVYEGVGSEIHQLADLMNRDDLDYYFQILVTQLVEAQKVKV